MDNQLKEIFGAWLAAIGTVTSAVGSTPFSFIKKDLRNDLNVWGNVLQAVGNAVEADGQGELSLETIGNELQSVGNVTVITGLIIDFEDEIQQKLIIAGNWIQALGGATALGDEFEDTSNKDEIYNIIGNLLQSIGNSLQALSGVYELKASQYKDDTDEKNSKDEKNNKDENSKDEENDDISLLNVTGSWIQAVGSVISLIGQIHEESEESEEQNSD
ncbi:hypothetical protein COL32_18980 [Bacillus pseudomycoides]|uniref:DUF6944 family repetitive protein n=1 Tax=Bacillus pseudomycoides TaxID=64104 RepID=UPI000BF560E3|nr:hypothetical protein [Bacillus pseudomycoides]PFW98120.1 hypothetical protein COL29_00100 [Bacillus pseudomycoides]PFX41226.1 hypothetical protein COL32_18980 [Bacillus pseudomycoides]